MATYTPDQYGDLIERFVKGLPEVYKRASLLAAKDLEGNIKRRIFNTSGTKDIKGGTRGYRSERHIREREDNGLQIVRVDHSFTGSLKSAIDIREMKKSVDVYIQGGTKNIEVKKARGNERWFKQENGAAVFEANKAEEKRAIEIIDEEINTYINKFFD